jgi:hypothetical protein
MAPMASAFGAQGAAVSGPLDHATVVYGDGGIDQIAPQRPQPRKGALFVGAGEPAVTDYVTARMAASLRVPGTGSPSTAGESSTLIAREAPSMGMRDGPSCGGVAGC